MCGIAGEHRRDGGAVDADLLSAMADSMIHRGPDSAGYLLRPGVGFGFRRLSIIDLDGGDQPLWNEAETVFVQGNGEVYNYRELRAELIGLGCRFKTNSDIEVVVHGFDRWGLDVLDRLNGIFALAIWDETERRLILVRDHHGVKPLYYRDAGRRLTFGSEMRAIHVDRSAPMDIDQDGLRLLLHFGYIPSPHTLVDGVKKLAPGHLLISDADGSTVRRYWNPVPVTDTDISAGDAADRYAELVSAAVERQLVSDVPVGLLLSGGVDSSMVLAKVREASAEPLQTFTVGFGSDFEHDEAEHAAETARLFGTDHHQIDLDLGSFEDILAKTLWHLEEPVLSQSTFAYQLLTEEVGKHVKVVLAGQGADELWAGYRRYVGELYGGGARRLLGSSAVRSLGERVPALGSVRRASASLGLADPVDRFAAIHQVFDPADIAAAARGGLTEATATAQDVIRYWQEPVNHLDPLNQLLYVDTRVSLADDLLLYGDKLSMSNSVEARVPLLDIELSSFVEGLPTRLKLNPRGSKYLHKKVAARMLPKQVMRRPKKGFATPVDAWFATEFASTIQRSVLRDDSWSSRHLDRRFLQTYLDDHVSGRRNNRRQLTTLLSLEIVCDQIFSGVGPSETMEFAS
ncbi:MAG: asparagine synthase (glutamine-hydrolyzing) [Actinomycetota bacterium]